MDVHNSNLTSCCHISLPCIMNIVINANHQRSQPTHSHCTMCQYVECHHLILILILLLLMLHRPGRPSGVDPPHHTIKLLHFVLFHIVTCYAKSMVSRIHVNTAKLCNITCTLVAIGVICSLERTNIGIKLTFMTKYQKCHTNHVQILGVYHKLRDPLYM